MRSLREVMRGNLLVFTLGDVMRQLSMFITFPFFSLYVQALGGSNVDIGIVNALRPLASLFIYPVAGYLSDRHSRVRIIATTGYLTSFIWLFFVLAGDWRMLAVGNLLLGLMTFYFPAANALMADSLPPEKRGVGYSLWVAVPSAVGIMAPYIGGYLTTYMGVVPAMRVLYGLTLLMGLAIATMNLKFLEERPGEEGSKTPGGILKVLSSSYRDVFKVTASLPRSLKAFTLLLALSFFFNNMTVSYWVVHAVDQIGLTKLQWGTVLLIAAVVNVALLLPGGFVVDRVGAKRVLTFALGLSAVPLLLFPVSRGFWDVTLLFAVMTFTNSFLVSGAPAYMAQAVPPERRGRVMAALGQGMLLVNTRGGGSGGPGMGAILAIPSIIGSVLGGFVYDYNPALPWVLFGASMVVSSVICGVFVTTPDEAQR
jgi:MFS family permease